MAFPLRYLGFYKVKKDFSSAHGYAGSVFRKDKLVQYQKTDSDVYGMMEIVSFIDWNSKESLIWYVNTDELYDRWQDYLEPTKL